VLHQCASRRIYRIETIFEAWFWSCRCGYVVGLVSWGAWVVGGGFCLCLPPGGGACLSLKTPLNTSACHCGGTSVSRWRTGAGREPPSLRLLAEVPRDAGPLWSRGFMRLVSAAGADSRSPRPSRSTKAGALWQTPAKAPQSVGRLLDSSVSRLGRQSFEGHGVCPVDKALRHGDSALGIGPGVFCHIYAFKHLRLLMAIIVLVSWLKSLRSAGLCVA